MWVCECIFECFYKRHILCVSSALLPRGERGRGIVSTSSHFIYRQWNFNWVNMSCTWAAASGRAQLWIRCGYRTYIWALIILGIPKRRKGTLQQSCSLNWFIARLNFFRLIYRISILISLLSKWEYMSHASSSGLKARVALLSPVGRFGVCEFTISLT